MRRLRALMKKEFTHMRHDPRIVFATILMPVIQLVLLGYIGNTEITNVPTVVLDQDNSPASRALLDSYRTTGTFAIDYLAYSQDDVNRMIGSGEAKVGIIIPPDYSSELAAGRTSQIAVLIDGSDPTVANTALAAASLAAQAHSTTIRAEQLAALGANVSSSSLPVEARTQVLYNPDLLGSYNTVPGVMAMVLFMTTTTLTSAAIVKERERGTIEQLVVTPIRNWELIIAKITPYVIVSMVDVVIILIIATVLFGVPIRGSLLLLLALSGLYLLPNLGLGLVISSFAQTQQQAQMMMMPIMLPSYMLSGFIIPVATLPAFLQVVSSILPMTYYLTILRAIVIKGAGLELLIPQIIALIIFSFALMAFAALRFRKSLD